MNNLPDDVIQQIYFYQHNLEFVEVMNQLLREQINVYFNISSTQCRVMYFVKHNIEYLSLNVNELNATPTHILYTIQYYNTYFLIC